jgi:hypothetical protein
MPDISIPDSNPIMAAKSPEIIRIRMKIIRYSIGRVENNLFLLQKINDKNKNIAANFNTHRQT